MELIKVAYPDRHDLDGRSKEGRLVKEFLAEKDIKENELSTCEAKSIDDLWFEEDKGEDFWFEV